MRVEGIMMKMLILLVVIVEGVVSAVSTFASDNEDEQLAAMRTNDVKFDRIRLREKRTWDGVLKQSRFDYERFGGDASKMPDDYWDEVKYKGLAHEELIVFGKRRVLSVDFDDAMKEADKYARIGTGFTRTGDFGKIYYTLDDMQLPDDSPSKHSPNYEKQLRVLKMNFSLGVLYDSLMAREFTYGIGYARRITEVASRETKADRVVLRGQIKIWTEDVSDFEIELDKHGIVRKATINCNVRGNLTRFEVTSEGIVELDGLTLAKRGHFRRLHVPPPEKNGAKSSVSKDFRLELVEVETGIGPMRAEKLMRFDLLPLMQYNNDVDNLHGTGIELEDGTIALKTRSGKILTELPSH